ncbi:MAG TPA: hypothetical protein ENI06_02620 [Spirochaetales bacterium]|nr:hypothetical protein [Spirochaetales bacterium]
MIRYSRLSSRVLWLILIFINLSYSIWILYKPGINFQRYCWQGYYTLFIRGEELGAELTAELRALPGVTLLLSEDSSTLSFNSLNGMEKVTLARVADRLDENDPRFDSYMKELPGYFKAEKWETKYQVLYLRAKISPVALYSLLALVIERHGSEFRMLEYDPQAAILYVALFLFFSLFLFLLRAPAGYLALSLSGLLPWLLNILTGNFLDLISFYLIFPFQLIFFGQLFRVLKSNLTSSGSNLSVKRAAFKSVIMGFAFFLTVFVLANLLVILPVPDSSTIIRNLSALALNILAYPFLYLLLSWRAKYIRHFVFEPLPILGRSMVNRKISIGRGVWLFPLLLIIFISLPLAFLEKRLHGFSYPAPRLAAFKLDKISWESLEHLQLTPAASDLPDLSDFLTHSAFQQGIFFGREYIFPYPGERLYISRYFLEENGAENGGRRISKRLKMVRQYKTSWLFETLSGMPANSVGAMLAAQERAVQVVRSSEAVRLLKQTPWWKISLFFLFLSSFYLIWQFYLTPWPLYGTRNLVFRKGIKVYERAGYIS